VVVQATVAALALLGIVHVLRPDRRGSKPHDAGDEHAGLMAAEKGKLEQADEPTFPLAQPMD